MHDKARERLIGQDSGWFAIDAPVYGRIWYEWCFTGHPRERLTSQSHSQVMPLG
jgi:hypothetical protein